MQVLVVDDSAAVRSRLAEMLLGIKGVERVGTADSPAAAFGAIREEPPHVVVLDIQMPGGSGLEVLRAVRRAGLQAVVIVLTNYATPRYREICLSEGADFFFDKTAEFKQVGEVVGRLARAAGTRP